MKFIDLRKYFFSYPYIIFSMLGMGILWYANTLQTADENLFPSANDVIAALAVYPFIAFFCCLIALILEILFRHFVIKKYFLNLKFSFVIKIPKVLNTFLSSIFYLLFAISTIPILFLIFGLVLNLIFH